MEPIPMDLITQLLTWAAAVAVGYITRLITHQNKPTNGVR